MLQTYNILYIVSKMECPYCGDSKSKVTNKRKSLDSIRRRRECLKCGKRFTTYETIVREDLYVVKKDKSREKFSRDKLAVGIEKAFEKRPVAKEEIEKMIHEIEEQLRKKGKEVKSSVIGELIMKRIKKVDNVAFIRFASVYKDFQDVKDFKKGLKEL